MGVMLQSEAAFGANAFLRSLTATDAEILAPYLVETTCCSGELLQIDAGCEGSIYFPVSMVGCVSIDPHDNAVGLVGREGLIGWPALLRQRSLGQRATVLLDGGTAFVLPINRMRAACRTSSTLTMSVLCCVNNSTEQMSRMIVAASRNSLKERLCAWLLMLHDRIEGDFIRITHRNLARQLGVRRASVTDLLHTLEGECALHCNRSLIFIRDRSRLELSAGEAYGRGGLRALLPATSRASAGFGPTTATVGVAVAVSAHEIFLDAV